MSFNRETEERIQRFAQVQSQNYLEEAEMTYLEKLRRKSYQTKDKITRKASRFKRRSDIGLDAQNDMVLYMSDFMADLVSQGLSEQEAFEKASEALKLGSGSEQSAYMDERLRQYIESRDPAEQETIGGFFGGFTLIGLTLGGLIGFLCGGGRTAFLSGGWIDTLIGVGVGLLIGTGLGLIAQGLITLKNRK